QTCALPIFWPWGTSGVAGPCRLRHRAAWRREAARRVSMRRDGRITRGFLSSRTQGPASGPRRRRAGHAPGRTGGLRRWQPRPFAPPCVAPPGGEDGAMFAEADAVLLARTQFAFTVSFHFIFPAFSIGLASYLVV